MVIKYSTKGKVVRLADCSALIRIYGAGKSFRNRTVSKDDLANADVYKSGDEFGVNIFMDNGYERFEFYQLRNKSDRKTCVNMALDGLELKGGIDS